MLQDLKSPNPSPLPANPGRSQGDPNALTAGSLQSHFCPQADKKHLRRSVVTPWQSLFLLTQSLGMGILHQNSPEDKATKAIAVNATHSHPKHLHWVQPKPDGSLLQSCIRGLSDNIWGKVQYGHSKMNFSVFAVKYVLHHKVLSFILPGT